MPIPTIHSVLYDLSIDEIQDREESAKYVSQKAKRQSRRPISPLRMQEETSTENFARRVSSAFSSMPGYKATSLLHTRKLETITGADIELCLEVQSNLYLNLALQAKRLDVSTSTPRYNGWNYTQNQNLIQSARSDGRVPGMLLYNEPVATITHNTATVFQACLNATSINKRGYYPSWTSGSYTQTAHLRGINHPPYSKLPNTSVFRKGTPAGISMCLDEQLMQTQTNPSLQDIAQCHFPLEHLMHASGCCNFGGLTDRGFAIQESSATSGIQFQTYMPEWAAILLEETNSSLNNEFEPENFDEARHDEDFEPTVAASIIIQLDN